MVFFESVGDSVLKKDYLPVCSESPAAGLDFFLPRRYARPISIPPGTATINVVAKTFFK